MKLFNYSEKTYKYLVKYLLLGFIVGLLIDLVKFVYGLIGLSKNFSLSTDESTINFLSALEKITGGKYLQNNDWFGRQPNGIGHNILMFTEFILPVIICTLIGLIWGIIKARKESKKVEVSKNQII
jgi:hypothetical protein